MKLSVPIQVTLMKLTPALNMGDEGLIVKILDELGADGVKSLLSQDTIAAVRTKNLPQMVKFLCTLAAANDIEPEKAEFWLNLYTCCTQKKLSSQFAQRSSNNILKKVIEKIITEDFGSVGEFSKCKGDWLQWCHAVELALDKFQWKLAENLVDAAQSRKNFQDFWVEFIKKFSVRYFYYIDDMHLRKSGVDYGILASITNRCSSWIRNRHRNVYGALRRLQAGFLEVGGHHDQAIGILHTLVDGPDKLEINFEIARCLCRKGDYLGSIASLDRAIFAHNAPALSIEALTKVEGTLKTEDRKQAFNTEHASQTLRDLADALNKQGIKFFLVSGTLLGFARDGRIMPHDKDIDVGILGWEQQYTVFDALLKDGRFHTSPDFMIGADTVYIPIRHRFYGVWVDIFIYHESEQHVTTGVDFFFGHKQRFEFSKFDLKQVDFLGATLHVPDDIDRNLTENFGAWRQPDPDYISHLESPSTVDKGGLAYMVTARLSALAALAGKKPSRLRRIVSLMERYGDQPGAMSGPIRAQLLNAAQRMERESYQPLAQMEMHTFEEVPA